MPFRDHQDETVGRRDPGDPATVDRVYMAERNEVSQVQVREVARDIAVNRVILRADENAELVGDARVRLKLPELGGGAPGFDVQEHEVHVAASEDQGFCEGRTNLRRQVVFGDERDHLPFGQGRGNRPALLEAFAARPEKHDDQRGPFESRFQIPPDRLDSARATLRRQVSPRWS